MMTNAENNWYFSIKNVDENSSRMFIKNYQSSPVELVVTAMNEKLKSLPAKKEENKAG